MGAYAALETAARPGPARDIAPADAWHAAYMLYGLLGAGILFPWNSFVTAVRESRGAECSSGAGPQASLLCGSPVPRNVRGASLVLHRNPSLHPLQVDYYEVLYPRQHIDRLFSVVFFASNIAVLLWLNWRGLAVPPKARLPERV